MFGGWEMIGGVLSHTCTVNCTKEAAFPIASDAEHVTTVNPSGNTAPVAGTHETWIDGSTASEANGSA
jgi:hypothetical protein